MDNRFVRMRLFPLGLLVVLLGGPVATRVTAVAVDTDRDGLSNTWERTWSRHVITGRDLEVVDTTGLVNGP